MSAARSSARPPLGCTEYRHICFWECSGHGTGHGVGEYLSVHESQVGIAHSSTYFSEPKFPRPTIDSPSSKTDQSLACADSPLVPGHITSNEPGFYEEGSFGVRLESVLVVQEVKTRRQFGDRKWFGFERLTTVSPHQLPSRSLVVSVAQLLTRARSAGSDPDAHDRLEADDPSREGLDRRAQPDLCRKVAPARQGRQASREVAQEAVGSLDTFSPLPAVRYSARGIYVARRLLRYRAGGLRRLRAMLALASKAVTSSREGGGGDESDARFTAVEDLQRWRHLYKSCSTWKYLCPVGTTSSWDDRHLPLGVGEAGTVGAGNTSRHLRAVGREGQRSAAGNW